jgi:hypothetical protein
VREGRRFESAESTRSGSGSQPFQSATANATSAESAPSAMYDAVAMMPAARSATSVSARPGSDESLKRATTAAGGSPAVKKRSMRDSSDS